MCFFQLNCIIKDIYFYDFSGIGSKFKSVFGGGLDFDNQKKGGDGYVYVFMYKFLKM